MIVKVLLNTSTDGWRFIKGYTEGDPMTVAMELVMHDEHAADAHGVLDLLFRELNIDEPQTEWGQGWRRFGMRSLSVGDVVVLGEVAYGCDPVGWRQVTLTTDQIVGRLAAHVDE